MLHYKITIASKEDIENIRGILLEFHKVSPFKDILVDPDKLTSFITNSIENPNAIVLLAYADTYLVGLLIGSIQEIPFSLEKNATENIWYVRKKYRSYSIGKELYQLYEKWSKEHNVSIICTSAPITNEELKAFYINRGYQNIEEVYMQFKEQNDGSKCVITSG